MAGKSASVCGGRFASSPCRGRVEGGRRGRLTTIFSHTGTVEGRHCPSADLVGPPADSRHFSLTALRAQLTWTVKRGASASSAARIISPLWPTDAGRVPADQGAFSVPGCRGGVWWAKNKLSAGPKMSPPDALMVRSSLSSQVAGRATPTAVPVQSLGRTVEISHPIAVAHGLIDGDDHCPAR